MNPGQSCTSSLEDSGEEEKGRREMGKRCLKKTNVSLIRNGQDSPADKTGMQSQTTEKGQCSQHMGSAPAATHPAPTRTPALPSCGLCPVPRPVMSRTPSPSMATSSIPACPALSATPVLLSRGIQAQCLLSVLHTSSRNPLTGWVPSTALTPTAPSLGSWCSHARMRRQSPHVCPQQGCVSLSPNSWARTR